MSASAEGAAVEALIREAVSGGVLPGAAIAVWLRGRPRWRFVHGAAELQPLPRVVAPDTAWDLASLTKVLVATPLAMAMVTEGLLDLDAPIDALLAGAPPRVTARHLLAHTSGLPAWRPLFEEIAGEGLTWGSEAARRRLAELAWSSPVEAAPGERACYSDLGFLTLGALLERLGGDRLDRLWEGRVRAPAGVDLRWGWPGAAATEDCPVRRRVIVGEVHDLNSAVGGGITAHAGLFGPVDQVARAGAWQLSAARGGVPGIAGSVAREFLGAQGLGGRHLGWDGVSETGSSAGASWPADGVGHLGFTGCSLWMAPRQALVVAFLSNRVHPLVEGGARPPFQDGPRLQAMRRLRPAVHEAIWSWLSVAGEIETV